MAVNGENFISSLPSSANKKFYWAFTVLIDLNNLLALVPKISKFFFPSLFNVYEIRLLIEIYSNLLEENENK